MPDSMKRLALPVVLVLALCGCESVTSDNIRRWKNTQKGPGKLLDALKDAKVAPRLRAEAAAALVDIDQADQVDLVMAEIPAGERWEIIKTLIPVHAEGMKDANMGRARAARDGLFSVRGFAPPEERRQIDATLMPMIERDLRAGRAAGGRHSMDKMLAAMGPAAGPMLVGLLRDPKVPYPAVVELLVRVGDDPTRSSAGAVLVRRAAAMPEIPPALWRSLGALGGKAVVDFLVAKIEKGGESAAVAAAQALQQRREPSVLPSALRIAADPQANKAVRDEMFGVVEKIGGLEAQRGLVAIISSDPVDLVRYRAFEAALEVGKGNAVLPALEAFPEKGSYKREDVVDFLVKDITKIGSKAKPAVLGAFASSSTLARMAAVLALEAPLPGNPHEDMGSAADVAALLKLSGDGGRVAGFPAGDTVGKEAVRVAELLRKRGVPKKL